MTAHFCAGRRTGSLLLLAVTLAAGPAWAQPTEYEDGEEEPGDEDPGEDPGDDPGEDPGEDPGVDPGDDPPEQPFGATALAAGRTPGRNVLKCSGGWRYELDEIRDDTGPARFARQFELQKDLQFATAAFGYCQEAAGASFAGAKAAAKGPCAGLVFLADRVDIAAANLFRMTDRESCDCLTQPVGAGGACESLRAQLTSLRRYDQIVVQRAELVLATQVCTGIERTTNSQLRESCGDLMTAVRNEAQGAPLIGMFSLSAPLPSAVAAAIDKVRDVTDGRYASVLPENHIGIRNMCGLPPQAVKKNFCSARALPKPDQAPGCPTCDAQNPDPKLPPTLFRDKQAEVSWGMCNELALADVNANTCRDSDVYIDERGQLHLNRPLTTREQRQNATLCVDISDFDQQHPLMVTLGLDPTGSVPKRLWPGETMRIGDIIDRPVTREDILHIHVFGKARGVSLGEVLRVNGLTEPTAPEYREESCRIARSWVPVVDHEVPIGAPNHQAVIPIKFDRGRDGSTQRISGGDFVVLWVRDIEPSGAVMVEYADGQHVGYKPPPLLGASDSGAHSEGEDPATASGRSTREPGVRLNSDFASVGQPLLPRRARYPGSRVLRLGSPTGSSSYDIKVCKWRPNAAATPMRRRDTNSGGACNGQEILLEEQMFVHGDSHFGVKFHFGYSYFPLRQLEARRTPAAIEAGDDIYEVVESGGGKGAYDIAVLLAIYPFGRDPRDFSYNPFSKRYWKHAALQFGFTVRSLTPWNDFYAGASLPIANGVSLDIMGHFGRRSTPANVQPGMLVDNQDLNAGGTKESLALGFTVGVSLDYNLFERAFKATWEKLSGQQGSFFGAPSGNVTDAGGGIDG